MATVDLPVSDSNAKVRSDAGTNYICAAGNATIGGVICSGVWAKVYTGTLSLSDLPDIPPADAKQTTPDAKGNWQYAGSNSAELPGANCSGSSPYPANTLGVWYQTPAMGGYTKDYVHFYGLCSTQTDCGPV
jgi:hypothetical protein